MLGFGLNVAVLMRSMLESMLSQDMLTYKFASACIAEDVAIHKCKERSGEIWADEQKPRQPAK